MLKFFLVTSFIKDRGFIFISTRWRYVALGMRLCDYSYLKSPICVCVYNKNIIRIA